MEPTTDQPLCWTVPQVARLLHCATSEVYSMCRSGALPSIRLGRSGRAVRVPREALESWVRARTVAADPSSRPGVGGHSFRHRSDRTSG
jgi:excisionase family DNA binding protein